MSDQTPTRSWELWDWIRYLENKVESNPGEAVTVHDLLLILRVIDQDIEYLNPSGDL